MAAELSNLSKTEYQRAFLRLAQTLGEDLAFFCICAVADVPYRPDAEASDWKEYEKIAELSRGGERLGFSDGETDVNEVLKMGMDDHERWLLEWGFGSEDRPYTDNEYRQLDALYSTMTGQLDRLGSLTKQQEDTARFCAGLAMKRMQCVAKGDKESIDIAAKLDKMIRDNLADCNMRSRDILPTQQQRPDGFVDALRNKYGLSVEMTKDDVLEAFYKWCRSRNYPQTVDAEEKALLAIIQTMQKNDDLPVSQELPEDARLNEFAFEFADEPNEDEQNAYAYLGLVRDGKSGDA